ncbi:hypothetical protein H5410_065045 [Solanum commersonii]|uniref:Uncharacterized protein n=1 Tax=Solanum commersonii TaxID=4109 RepID=A0A9J5VXN2_SOLCO|nr:hypothetical protein H5410_065045 [Solanum commersonii]
MGILREIKLEIRISEMRWIDFGGGQDARFFYMAEVHLYGDVILRFVSFVKDVDSLIFLPVLLIIFTSIASVLELFCTDFSRVQGPSNSASLPLTLPTPHFVRLHWERRPTETVELQETFATGKYRKWKIILTGRPVEDLSLLYYRPPHCRRD